jgi:4-hydroxy-tetrahydrodipicolinate synthase
VLSASDLRGIVTPILTLFDRDDQIDEAALRRLVRHQIDNGVSGLFALGSSSEFALLADAERRRTAEIIIDEAAGAVPCLMGAIGEGPERVLELASVAPEVGADAIVVTTPYYFGWNAAEIERFFGRIADRSPLPVVLYDIPWRTYNDIARDTILRLSEHPNIIGLKDTTQNGGRFISMLLELEGRDDFAMFQGSEPLALPSFTMGAAGAVFSLANVAPRTSVELYEACKRGDMDEAKRLQRVYDRLFAIFGIIDPVGGSISGGLGGLKVGLELLGIATAKVRFPADDFSGEAKQKIAALLREIPETAERLG